MDMTSDMSSNSTMMGMMKPYLHFTPGDFLFFSNIQPTSTGAVVAACLVLFSLAFIERLLAAYGRVTEKKWNDEYVSCFSYDFCSLKLDIGSFRLTTIIHARKRPIVPQSLQSRSRIYPHEKKGGFDTDNDVESMQSVNVVKAPRVLPFVSKIEIKRGLNRAVGSLFTYTLMLAVMYVLDFFSDVGIGSIVICLGPLTQPSSCP